MNPGTVPLDGFVRAVAAPVFAAHRWSRDGLRFRRPFGEGDTVVAEFRAYVSGRAPVEFRLDVGVVVAPYLEFLFRGRPPRGRPSPAHGLWQGRLTPSEPAPGGAWAIDPRDPRDPGPASDFVAALDRQLDEVEEIADRRVLLRLARDRAGLADRSRSGIVLSTAAAEALLLLGRGDEAGARAAADELRSADVDDPVAAWVLTRLR